MKRTLAVAVTMLVVLPTILHAGLNAGATFSLSNPVALTRIGPGDTVEVTINAAGLVDVTQFEITLEASPADAFDLAATTFTIGGAFDNTPGVDFPGPTAQVTSSASIRTGPAVNGACELGTFMFTRSANYPGLAEGGTYWAIIRIVQISIGPTATNRDVFSAAGLSLSFILNPAAQWQSIITVAGTGSTAYYPGNGGPATSTNLNSPSGIALDVQGNIYIASTNDHRICRVDRTTGVLTRVVGCDFPSAVAVDGQGNLFVASPSDNMIYRVDETSGLFTTVAGTGSEGYSGDGGPATSAKLFSPDGIAVDAQGNLYIADSWKDCVRRVDGTTGIITTVAGNGSDGYSGDGGQASSSYLNYPCGIAVDAQGNLYIADTRNNRIRRVDGFTGVIRTIAGNGAQGYSGDGGQARSARLNLPQGIAVDGLGNVYVADTENNRVRRVDAETGIITTVAGNGITEALGDWGPATSASLVNPTGIAVDGQDYLYIADRDHHRIRKVFPAAQPNRPPVLQTIADQSIAEGNLYTLQLAASDADGDALTYSVSGNPPGSTLIGTTFTWTPDYFQAGSYPLLFSVSDSRGGADTDTVTITVTDTNRPPVLSAIGPQSVAEDVPLSLALAASDADGDTLTYSVSGNPDGSVLQGAAFSWTPQYAQAGVYPVTFSVSDGKGGTATEVVTITVAERTPGPVSIDFDLAKGDQRQARAGKAKVGKTYELQLYVTEAPEIRGWSTIIEYNPQHLQYVDGSFAASDYIPGLVVLVDDKPGIVGVGGAVLGSDTTGTGSGTLGTMSFQILEGFRDSTVLAVTSVTFRRADGMPDKRLVRSEAVVTAATVTGRPPGDFDGSGIIDFADFFMFADVFGTSDPICDLDGSGTVDFADFFIFADNFGGEARAKLIELAEYYLDLPSQAILLSNYPNPFNSDTVIRFALPTSGLVDVSIYNLMGQRVASLVREYRDANTYTVSWGGCDERGCLLASGTYLYRLQAGGQTMTRKLLLLR